MVIDMTAPTETSTGVYSVWKVIREEFYATDFQAIADALSLPLEQVKFEITPAEHNGVDGNILSGSALT